MVGAPYPPISHLEIEICDFDPQVLLGISIALKSSLKLLSLHQFVCGLDPEPLLPVYETLRETLMRETLEGIEGISVNAGFLVFVTPMLHGLFPKTTRFCNRWLAELSRQVAEGGPLFSSSN
jgi:hypothetical protein